MEENERRAKKRNGQVETLRWENLSENQTFDNYTKVIIEFN